MKFLFSQNAKFGSGDTNEFRSSISNTCNEGSNSMRIRP